MRITQQPRSITIDWLTLVLVGVIVGIVSAAIGLTNVFPSLETGSSAQHDEVELAGILLVIIVLQSLLIVVGWNVWKRLSAFVRTALKRSILVGFVALLALDLYVSGLLLEGAIGGLVLVGAWLVYRRFSRSGLRWIAFDAVGILLAVGIIALFGSLFAPVVIVPLLAALIVLDHVEVNLTGMMSDIVEFSGSTGIPNHLIIPNRLFVDMDDIRDYVVGKTTDRPAGIELLIGVGDFAFPGLLAVSVWVAGFEQIAGWTLLGIAVGFVALRDALDRASAGLPALPWVNTGAIVGFLVGVLVTGTPLLVALGV